MPHPAVSAETIQSLRSDPMPAALETLAKPDIGPAVEHWILPALWKEIVPAGCLTGLTEELRPLAHPALPLLRLIRRDAKEDGVPEVEIHFTDESLRVPLMPGLPELAPRDREPSWGLDESLKKLPQRDRVTSNARAAGWLQMNDALSAGHEAAQAIEGEGSPRNGDYWHTIMHRREPDPGNAKYWCRQVGKHPIHAPLARFVAKLRDQTTDAAHRAALGQLISPTWQPTEFVDLTTLARRGNDTTLILLAETIQWAEMCLLLQETVR